MWYIVTDGNVDNAVDNARLVFLSKQEYLSYYHRGEKVYCYQSGNPISHRYMDVLRHRAFPEMNENKYCFWRQL